MKLRGFSWKKASGLTKAKRGISKATGIPTSKSRRKGKMKRIAAGKGCMVTLLLGLSVFILVAVWFLSGSRNFIAKLGPSEHRPVSVIFNSPSLNK